MKDPESVGARQELITARRKALAARLRSWEKYGPGWLWRLGVLLNSVLCGCFTVLSVKMLLFVVQHPGEFRTGFLSFILLFAVFFPAVLLFFKFSPWTSPHSRLFDKELTVGFVAGLMLMLLLSDK